MIFCVDFEFTLKELHRVTRPFLYFLFIIYYTIIWQTMQRSFWNRKVWQSRRKQTQLEFIGGVAVSVTYPRFRHSHVRYIRTCPAWCGQRPNKFYFFLTYKIWNSYNNFVIVSSNRIRSGFVYRLKSIATLDVTTRLFPADSAAAAALFYKNKLVTRLWRMKEIVVVLTYSCFQIRSHVRI